MRFTRSVMVFLAVAIAAAGCARQPLAPVPVAADPAAPLAAAPARGIDNVIYGPVPAPLYASVATPAPAAGRGLMTAGSRAAPATTGAVVAPAPVAAAAPTGPLAYAPALRADPYSLDSGDRLRVVVFGQDGLSNSYLVDASGYIAMPLIGSVPARGVTTDELSSRIAERLRQGFIREPHVAVEIEAYRPFFILGEVAAPGQYPFVASMTAETAVAIAGGFAPRAYRKTVTLTRIIDGRQVAMIVPVNYPLRPGDTINVQERWF